MDFERGRIVRSTAGRDKGLYLAVVADAGNRILVADGRRRPLSAPKAKNPAHLAPTRRVIGEEQLGSDKLLSAAIAAAFPAAQGI
ncbi:MAG TPA: KOW domain-containing RNA-binding protein [Candidatus Pygmaiobacter gallistercoris]|nr:KOW domain-containing RNA-binding protein [Candidatus Pygmaiobacter gallistercoris]